MDNQHKVELTRSAQQASAASQILKQNNGMLIDIGNQMSAVGSGLAQQETTRGMEITMIKNSHQAIDCLGERLHDLASMSKGQSETLLEKFEQLQSQIEELKAVQGQTPTAHSSTMKKSDKMGQEEEDNDAANKHRIDELSESVKRLCSFASKPKHTVFSHEAQCIISDIDQILTFISASLELIEPNESRKRKHDQIADVEFVETSQIPKFQSNLRKMRGLLTSSEHVSVNQQASFSETSSLEDRRHRCTMNRQYDTELGFVSVQMKRRRLLKITAPQTDILDGEFDQQVHNIFEGTVSLIPKREVSRTKISASFLQKCTGNGYFSLKPTLSFCAIVPDHSLIFYLTSKGDLKGMINHIQEGNASLTDCDSKGRTLLNYALHHGQFDVSKFLINAGADVDAIEHSLCDNDPHHIFRCHQICRNRDLSPHLARIPHYWRISKFHQDAELRPGSTNYPDWRLIRLLLEAGADPTNHHSSRHGPQSALIYSVTDSNAFASLKWIFDYSAEFIDLEARLDGDGRTLLLLCTCGSVDPQCVQFLLDKGADVRAKDHHGNTCLHNIFDTDGPLRDDYLRRMGNRYKSDGATLVQNSLVLLIQAGADVYAKTNAGESVSEKAYGTSFRDPWPTILATVWEEALTACGYDATWFRENHCRRYHHVFGWLCCIDEISSLDTRCSEYSRQESEGSEQSSESNEQDFERCEDDEGNSEGNKLNFEAFRFDDQGFRNIERAFDPVTQGLKHTSPRYDSISACDGSRSFSYATEHTMDDVNVWKQADIEPAEEDIKRPVTVNLPQERFPWVEDVPDGNFGRAWDSNHVSRVASPISHKIFEIEDGEMEDWNTL